MNEINYFYSKTLFLWLNENEFHAINAKIRGVNTFQIYQNLSRTLKVFRNIHIKLNWLGISVWLDDWKNELNKYETVIIHASILTPPVVKYIRKMQPNIRIILWYWNPVDKCVDISKFRKYNCEIWSFDEFDCEKYNLNYNSQYYFKDIVLPMGAEKNDVFFVGGDKGRTANLIALQEQLNAQDITNYFHITPTGKLNTNYRDYYSGRISYDEVLKHIASCKAIVDYVSEKQTGLTLRPLEALFFKKKLITNDESIRNRDFYKKENIFILGNDEITDLAEFLNKPYKDVNSEIVDQYDFNSWLNRFFDYKEKKENS
jgi:hypothetical protein